MKCTAEMASGGMVYLPDFMMISFGILNNIKVYYCNGLGGCSVDIADERDL
jgi:hypothetical protein